MIPIVRTETEERLARIKRMIEEYRAVKQRRLSRRAIRLWRKAEIRQQIAQLDAPPERVHENPSSACRRSR